MIDNRLRLRHLQCFLETARLGSLSAAAHATHVSQPAASKTLRELEEIIGKPLFERANRRLSLTTAGRVFQQHAGAAMAELARAQDLVRNAPARSTKLAVGTLPTAATALMPRAALVFRDTFPNCLLRVSTGPNWLLMSQLREGQLDLVVGRMGSAEVMAQLAFHPLYSEDIVAVVRPDHPLRDHPDPLTALDGVPLILPPPGAVIAPTVRALLARHGVSPHLAAFESVSLAFGRRVVRDSDAVWFISQGVVSDDVEAGVLDILPMQSAMRGGPVGVTMRAEGPPGPEAHGLVAALEQASAAMAHSAASTRSSG